MSVKRRVEKLNTILRRELGTNPWPTAWIHTRAPGLRHPVAQNDSFDYLCSCGRNKQVHSTDCTGLIRAVRPVVLTWLLPAHPDHWLLCREHKVNRDSWVKSFGHDATYRPTVWHPLEIDNLRLSWAPPGYLLLYQEPTLDQTELVVEMVKAWNSRKPSEWMELLERRIEKKEREADEEIYGAIYEKMYPRPWAGHPGFVKLSTSYPTVARKS